jgi:transcriptional regulator with XRE-family HTH domain
MSADPDLVPARLTPCEWLAVRARRVGLRQAAIGEALGVSGSYVGRVLRERIQDSETQEKIAEVIRQEEDRQRKLRAQSLRRELAKLEAAA